MHFACKEDTFKRIPRRNCVIILGGKMFCKWLFKMTVFQWYFKLLPQTVKISQFLKQQLYHLMFLGKQLSKFSQLAKNPILHLLGRDLSVLQGFCSTEHNAFSREKGLWLQVLPSSYKQTAFKCHSHENIWNWVKWLFTSPFSKKHQHGRTNVGKSSKYF